MPNDTRGFDYESGNTRKANGPPLQRALEAVGVEFTNRDQPGGRLTNFAATHSAKVMSASNPQIPRLPRKQPATRPPCRTRRNDRRGTERKRVTPPDRRHALVNAFPSFLRAMF